MFIAFAFVWMRLLKLACEDFGSLGVHNVNACNPVDTCSLFFCLYTQCMFSNFVLSVLRGYF